MAGRIDRAHMVIGDVDRTAELTAYFLPQLQRAWDTMGVGIYDVADGYVQWARFAGGLQIECVSNRFLEGTQLRFTERRALELLGFRRPEPPDWPNYFRRFEDEGELPVAAHALARVVIDVLEAIRCP